MERKGFIQILFLKYMLVGFHKINFYGLPVLDSNSDEFRSLIFKNAI